MKILKAQKLLVKHRRTGVFEATAAEDFDTNDEWYKVVTNELVSGFSTYWDIGEEIPCRKSLCKIEIIG